jgi:succinyl-CoA synthetase beta subunit
VYLLEHHGKELLAAQDIPVPPGVFVASQSELSTAALPSGPWMVKAQVAAGGRGKAGAVRTAASREDIVQIVGALAGTAVAGKPVQGFRIEQRVAFAHEAYLSFSIDAAAAQIRLMVAAEGGVDVESLTSERLRAVLADPDRLAEAAQAACAGVPLPVRDAMLAAAQRLTPVFLACEATLLEVNPLFVLPDGGFLVGDLKLVVDDDALVRQPALRELAQTHPDIYPEIARKLAHGFDYVEIDPDGEIGLITTGAGLSMQLIDELRAQGRRPLNFCDIRSGQFRGDPARLIAVMRWIAARPRVQVVLVNIFAGITDLAEFARLLVAAMTQVPELRVPIVARLIGRNLDEATDVLAGAGLAVTVEPDLERAVALTLTVLAGEGVHQGVHRG